MKRGRSLVIGVPLLKKYMKENDIALTKEKAIEVIQGSTENAYTILNFMEGADIVGRVRRGHFSYYALMEVFDEGRLEEVLEKSGAPKKKVHIPRIRRVAKPKTIRRGTSHDKHIAAIRRQVESSALPSALGIIGLEQVDTLTKATVQPDGSDTGIKALKSAEASVGLVRHVDHGIIKVEAFGTVTLISKVTRLLTRGESGNLMSYLEGFEGVEKVKGYECIFVVMSALKRGEFGNVFYVSNGTNFWDLIKRVTLDTSIFRYQPFSSTERRRWKNWLDFDKMQSRKINYAKEEYEKIVDEFIERGDRLVEIKVEKRSPVYLRFRMGKILKERGLEKEIDVSVVDEYVYLEKLN